MTYFMPTRMSTALNISKRARNAAPSSALRLAQTLQNLEDMTQLHRKRKYILVVRIVGIDLGNGDMKPRTRKALPSALGT